MDKLFYVLLFFLIPIICLFSEKEYLLAGIGTGLLALIIFIEKSREMKEFVKKFF